MEIRRSNQQLGRLGQSGGQRASGQHSQHGQAVPHQRVGQLLSRRPCRPSRFEENLVDVVGLYLNPPHKALVLAMDAGPRSRRWTTPSPAPQVMAQRRPAPGGRRPPGPSGGRPAGPDAVRADDEHDVLSGRGWCALRGCPNRMIVRSSCTSVWLSCILRRRPYATLDR
jgi:hypothetical protein